MCVCVCYVIIGCNAEYTLVDERIVGRKPRTLSFRQAAGEPLTILTAWEGLVDGIRIPVPKCMQSTLFEFFFALCVN